MHRRKFRIAHDAKTAMCIISIIRLICPRMSACYNIFNYYLWAERSMEINMERRKDKNKMFIVRKRQVAATALILLIGIAGYLNLSIKDGESDPNIAVMYNEATKKLGEAKMVNSSSDSPSNAYFTNAKLEREKKRDESIEMLTEILNSQGVDAESRENAKTQIELLAQFTECEVTAENMIRAKGYEDCIVFMGENVTSIAVMTEGLNEIEAANIIQIAVDTGACSASEVKIVEIKPN